MVSLPYRYYLFFFSFPYIFTSTCSTGGVRIWRLANTELESLGAGSVSGGGSGTNSGGSKLKR